MLSKDAGKINLICFPYAGGSKYSYSVFNSLVSPQMNVLPFELPGRGDRLMEPLLNDIKAVVQDLFGQIENLLREPYILYGHSMGGLLAYLMAKKISGCRLPLPLKLVITGCEGPSVEYKSIKLQSDLPIPEFITELRALGGAPEGVLEDESFFNFFEPILRADLRVIEGYEYQESFPLDIPICVMYGSEEDMTAVDVEAWQKESGMDVEMIQFPGNHFFIFNYARQIVTIIEQKLTLAGKTGP
ncbi:alpha/beta fold hydrolase [Flavitalea sp. BT771]|uniref:thioesterase II family protein n=1 Tax=Flavitalea sp. BT771 TaxID=3063329 RepID=UPI0026E2A75E|nr:alpha/beta fold hydrolase [Flavitalea sp. BT771]MDO6435743.1 alpha/beta fold hydrolase [Flavitalea sp. BT771]MDV6224644.1 alpha/beta fold hydrolase [Flavitalea sp. BT771]